MNCNRSGTFPTSWRYALARVERFEEAVLVAERGRARDLAEPVRLDQAPVSQLRPEDRRRFEEARSLVLVSRQGLAGAVRPRDDFLSTSPASPTLCVRVAEVVADQSGLTSLVPSAADCRRSPFRSAHLPVVYLIVTRAGSLALTARPGEPIGVRRRLDDQGALTPRSATGRTITSRNTRSGNCAR